MKTIFNFIFKQLASLFIILIKFYQIFLSPLLKSNCRFIPTCSEYAIESIRVYGLKGLIKATKRILSCHPFGNQGYDPVEKKIKN